MPRAGWVCNCGHEQQNQALLQPSIPVTDLDWSLVWMLWEQEGHLFSFLCLKHEEGKTFSPLVSRGGQYCMC